MPTSRHFAVERLSEPGQAIVRKGADEGWTLEKIVSEVAAATREQISTSAVHRWLQWEQTKLRFAERQSALDTATELIKALPDSRFLRSLNNAIKDHLLHKEQELAEQSLPDLMAHMLRMEKTELAHARLKVAQDMARAETIKAVAAEKSAEAALTSADAAYMNAQARVRQLEEQARKVAAELEQAAAKSTDGHVPAEVLKRIREDVYGLGNYEGGDDGPA